MKANCPLLARPTQAPAPATLRITDGSRGRAESLRARCRAFYLMVEEARAAPYIMNGVLLFIVMSII